MYHLIAVAPVYNEVNSIDLFLDEMVKLASSGFLKGLVLIDDGSTDGSADIIAARAENCGFAIRLVRFTRNFGHQNACLAGLKVASEWAVELGVEWVGLIDSDLQDNPLHFSALMAHHADNDVVYAVRAKRDDGWIRRVFAPLFYRFLSVCASFHIPVNAGTFSVMRCKVAVKIVEISDVDPYVPGLRAFVGFRQTGIPLERADRHKGRSRVGLLGLLLLSLRATILYTNVIHNFILYTGLVVFFLSLWVSVILFLGSFVSVVRFSGDWITWLMVSSTFGVHMIFLGALGHMINRVKANTSKQPPFVIMDDVVLGLEATKGAGVSTAWKG